MGIVPTSECPSGNLLGSVAEQRGREARPRRKGCAAEREKAQPALVRRRGRGAAASPSHLVHCLPSPRLASPLVHCLTSPIEAGYIARRGLTHSLRPTRTLMPLSACNAGVLAGYSLGTHGVLMGYSRRRIVLCARDADVLTAALCCDHRVLTCLPCMPLRHWTAHSHLHKHAQMRIHTYIYMCTH